ncbi:unnamed protein product [Rotaria socialis]|uniref:Uncharacterized protein n=1 Tax=Rotaria socialis TaxID=392032 RepID=A0A820R8G9_9BILA|nr:unnamed protein product [Rotaria socialis]CAF3409268.1 unnamed protein product [Rotaria socialis]CAF3656744.1 unnamed protein product [Rotaria socialis]CAF3752950.1 unnamed protein product [Rotaria socialis]CAF4434751.1 unnamed protein product [Rotaria socialis]
MLTTVILCILLTFTNQINGRVFHTREDSLTIMREKCAKNPYDEDCIRIKQQMEDLLRKCSAMATPVSACSDVKGKFCAIWSTELYCFISNNGGGGSQVTTKSPSWNTDPDWNQIPYDSYELKSRGDYCVTHQSEQKCRNLLNALKIRYDECSKRPSTDASCQSFKVSLCSAFPKFSPCLNGSSGKRRQATQLENSLRKRLQAFKRNHN